MSSDSVSTIVSSAPARTPGSHTTRRVASRISGANEVVKPIGVSE